MDRDALVEAMALVMANVRRTACKLPPLEYLTTVKLHERQALVSEARAALAVAEPVVRADERLACLNVAHRWTRDGHSATAHGIILGIEERTGGTP